MICYGTLWRTYVCRNVSMTTDIPDIPWVFRVLFSLLKTKVGTSHDDPLRLPFTWAVAVAIPARPGCKISPSLPDTKTMPRWPRPWRSWLFLTFYATNIYEPIEIPCHPIVYKDWGANTKRKRLKCSMLDFDPEIEHLCISISNVSLQPDVVFLKAIWFSHILRKFPLWINGFMRMACVTKCALIIANHGSLRGICKICTKSITSVFNSLSASMCTYRICMRV